VKTRAAILATLLIGVTAFAASPADRFESVSMGFSIEKPPAWSFATLQEIADNMDSLRFNDSAVQAEFERSPTAPLVMIMKHAEPYREGLNPCVEVVVRPIPPGFVDESASAILQNHLSVLRRAFKSFKLETPVREIEVSGLPAAELASTQLVETKDGPPFESRSRLVLVPHGKFMFLITASGPPSGPDESAAELEKILKSVAISE
jgi:hypothetical protein